MNARDLRDAEKLWRALRNDDAKNVATTALASQLRVTGLESTLRWLEAKSLELRNALCDALEIPRVPKDRAERSNLEVLSDNRRAMALADALHLIAPGKK